MFIQIDRQACIKFFNKEKRGNARQELKVINE